MKVAYVRVSTVEQNEARQTEALEKHGIERWFIEKVSGKDTNRPKLKEMMDFVREGDTVFVHEFSRLARSTKDLLNIVDLLESKKVTLVSNKENVDTGTPTGRLMLTMIAAIAEFERQNLLERQREGIAIQKELDKTRPKGQKKYMGRKEITVDAKTFDEAYERYMRREITKTALALELGVSRPTLDKLIKERKNQTA